MSSDSFIDDMSATPEMLGKLDRLAAAIVCEANTEYRMTTEIATVLGSLVLCYGFTEDETDDWWTSIVIGTHEPEDPFFSVCLDSNNEVYDQHPDVDESADLDGDQKQKLDYASDVCRFIRDMPDLNLTAKHLLIVAAAEKGINIILTDLDLEEEAQSPTDIDLEKSDIAELNLSNAIREVVLGANVRLEMSREYSWTVRQEDENESLEVTVKSFVKLDKDNDDTEEADAPFDEALIDVYFNCVGGKYSYHYLVYESGDRELFSHWPDDDPMPHSGADVSVMTNQLRPDDFMDRDTIELLINKLQEAKTNSPDREK